jgi:hypothetical protein
MMAQCRNQREVGEHESHAAGAGEQPKAQGNRAEAVERSQGDGKGRCREVVRAPTASTE